MELDSILIDAILSCYQKKTFHLTAKGAKGFNNDATLKSLSDLIMHNE